MGQMDDGLEEVANLSVTRFCDNEETLELLSGLVVNVRFGIGTPIELAPKFMSPTMWGTMSFMADEVLRVGTLVNKLTGVVNPFQLSTTQELLGIKTNGDMLAQVVTSLTGDSGSVDDRQHVSESHHCRSCSTSIRKGTEGRSKNLGSKPAQRRNGGADSVPCRLKSLLKHPAILGQGTGGTRARSVTTEDVEGAIRPGVSSTTPSLPGTVT
jgi:hypothetical protein